MASLSIDIATTFITLASKQARPLHNPRISFVPLLLRHNHKPFSSNSPSLTLRPHSSASLSLSSSQRLRRFSAAASSTAAQETEDDVATKIPPDNRIPATIITGFLGSGKVWYTNS